MESATRSLCFCAECGPSGTAQSQSNRRLHEKAQCARDRIRGASVARPSDLPDRGDVLPSVDAYASATVPPLTNRTLVDRATWKEPRLYNVPDNRKEEWTNSSSFLEFLCQAEARISGFVPPDNLEFSYPPLSPTSMYPGPDTSGSWETGAAAVLRNRRHSATVLLHLSFLRSVEQRLQATEGHLVPPSERRDALLSSIKIQYASIEKWRMSQWIRLQRHVPDPGGLRGASYDTTSFFETNAAGNRVASACVFLVVVLNLLYHLTLPACRLTIKILKRLIVLTLTEYGGTASNAEDLDKLFRAIPADVSTAVKYLNILPDSMTFVCCPECFALYPPDRTAQRQPLYQGTSLDDNFYQSTSDSLPFFTSPFVAVLTDGVRNSTPAYPYPSFCTHRETSESSQCGAKLLRENQHRKGSHGQSVRSAVPTSKFRPIRTYTYQPLISWIGRIMCRPDFERMIDASLVASTAGVTGEYVDDILQSPELTNFLHHDGEPFLRQYKDESRLVFSLFIDWFNPRGNRRSGASVSSGVIFMACLNLPADVRYKRENIYLAGVLPGPKSPSLQQVNHYIQPLIPELLLLWRKGVYLSRTARHEGGRVVKAALIPLVSDLGAVRKTSGNASHSATYFCSFCQLKKKNINDLDSAHWPRRDCRAFRQHAEAWKKAPNEKERKRLFKREGVRYSVLLELPYWMPTRFVVLDTMHNMFLGLFQRHCRNIMGMNIEVSDSSDTLSDDATGVIIYPVDLAEAVLELQRRRTPQALRSALNLPSMKLLYESAGLGPPGKKTKFEMATELFAKREAAVRTASTAPALTSPQGTSPRKRVILDKHVLEEVRADMAVSILPSSLGRAPVNVGSAGAGTLSADQWRTLCMIHLVTTLTRLWGSLPTTDRRRGLLENYLDLIAAVRYGTVRRASVNRVGAYNFHILRYIKGLRTLFPDQDLVPNQHLALHLGEVLERFGPTHCYWAFPFERYIRLLRQANMNYRNSETETTFFRSFCMANNLKNLLAAKQLPSVVPDLAELIDCAFIGELSEDSQDGDMHVHHSLFSTSSEPSVEVEETKAKYLSMEAYNSLLYTIGSDASLHNSTEYHSIHETDPMKMVLSSAAQFLSTVQHRGRRFATYACYPGDSRVLFRAATGSTSGGVALALGQIETIFVHRRRTTDGRDHHQTFAVLRPFTALSRDDQPHDPYRRYHALRTCLVYATPSQAITVVPMRDVVAQFASCPYVDNDGVISRPCIVVVPLDEVRRNRRRSPQISAEVLERRSEATMLIYGAGGKE